LRHIYSNPTTGYIILEITEGDNPLPALVSVHHIIGKRVIHKELYGKQNQHLNLSGLPRGIYLVWAMQGNEVGVEKLIVQ